MRIEEQFSKGALLTVTRGKIHECLGKTLDFFLEGKSVFLNGGIHMQAAR
jgi:hypothetical protein